ncbi:MAG: hypothetical protein K6C08_02555 [Oscillospiraceae bacterium]|nr:hypothetical protein [Oscillospiraceae bacterium]
MVDYLTQYQMLDPDFSIPETAQAMLTEMEKGLRGERSSYPMIPTFLVAGGEVPDDIPVVVIDAGGTNFRSALLRFKDGESVEEHLRVTRMPGSGTPVTWEEFIAFAADQIQPFISRTDRIGFCFSYTAEITPEIDGRVICIDKEVVVAGCEGKLVGESLSRELARRGFPGKRVVVLNDTAAVQLGGLARYRTEGFGQVSGTGTNTCCSIKGEQIRKLDGAHSMIINMEAGLYDGLIQGEFDRRLDMLSHNPGQKLLEKMTAGVYLGELFQLAARQAASDGVLSGPCRDALSGVREIGSAMADVWASGEKMDAIRADENDRRFLSELARFFFERSAAIMCANLRAMALLTGAGKERSAAVYAEGSLVQKNHFYRPELERLLKKYICEDLGRDIQLQVVYDTTLPGSAAAALLN